jgi:hypothetical protein
VTSGFVVSLLNGTEIFAPSSDPGFQASISDPFGSSLIIQDNFLIGSLLLGGGDYLITDYGVGGPLIRLGSAVGSAHGVARRLFKYSRNELLTLTICHRILSFVETSNTAGGMDHKRAIAALGALAQETRLDLFRLLVATGPEGMPAGVIAERLGVQPSSLSFHRRN